MKRYQSGFIIDFMNVNTSITVYYLVNHNSTGVSSGVSLVKKLKLEFEQNVNKMNYKTQKYT